jgi:hypothetical protein
VWRKVYERAEPRRDLTTIGLPAPEALWARQFSSQRTTRLFIENGPLQSDEFPVLEYEAPKAFYIGAHATEFRHFDERVRQHQLAPPPKRLALSAASAELLQPVFPTHGTVNADAAVVLNARLHGLTNAAAGPPPPSIFTPPRPPAEWQVEVLRVEQWLRSDGTNKSTLTMTDIGDAIRECLANGEFDRAGELLKRTGGGKLQPTAEHRFLLRVWQQATGKSAP